MEEQGPQAGDGLVYARFQYRPPEWQDLVQSIDVEALIAQQERLGDQKAPYVGVLDTNFFFSGFRSALKHGGLPRSIEAAKDGVVCLFLAERTLNECFEKLDYFAAELSVEARQLEEILAAWSPYIYVVDLDMAISDSRVEQVAVRDPDDRPAAALAALIAPCLLLTTDKDFEALGVYRPCEPVLAIKAAIVASNSETQLQALVTVPALPVIAATAGVKWTGQKLGIHPLILAVGLISLGVFFYRRQPAETRSVIRQGVSQAGKLYMTAFAERQGQQWAAIEAVDAHSVPRSPDRSAEAVVLAQLARSDGPISAERLREKLGETTRSSVTQIRSILRSNPAAVSAGRGIWTFGLPLDHLLECCARRG